MPSQRTISTDKIMEIPAAPPGVTLHTFDNQLTVIIREDHSAPVVSAQAWCMAGSIHEGEWMGAGLSHMLEHMLFKGTTSRKGSRIDQEVQEAGGYMNAYTSFDRTVYYIDSPSSGATVAIDILCDIMQNATLPAEEMEKEKQVITREMDMNVDDPGRRASRRLFETAYVRSPYRFTVIGYPDIFNELKAENIVDYYRQKYAPNNLFFVIVGDIKTDEVLEQVRQAFEKSKARSMPPMVLPSEPRQSAPRNLVEQAPIEIGHVHIAWHIPELTHPDMPALDVLSVLLGNGRSSRLYRQVRDAQGLVHSVDAWTYTPGGAGLFGVSANIDADKLDAAGEAILEEIAKVQAGSIDAKEISKAVKQYVTGTLATRKTMTGQAQDLGGNWLAARDLNFSARYLAAVKRVSAADLQRVSSHYLTPDNQTLYALMPKGDTAKAAAVQETNHEQPVKLFTLNNGLRLLIREDHRLPFVEFRAALKGGVIIEQPEINGLTHLLGRMLLKGTATRSADDIALAIESVGGSLDGFGGNNSFGVNAEVLNEDTELGLELLADVLLKPVFPESSVARERDIQLAAIRSQKDQLLQSAFQAMRRGLFGNIGYGLDSLGSEKSVQALGKSELQSFHQRLVSPGNCVLAIFGDVEAGAMLKQVEKAFGQWSTPLPDLTPALPDGKPESERIVEIRDKKQGVIAIGFPGCDLFNPDRYALELLQEACSDLGSRLFLRIREELGLAYFVGAQHFVGLAPGYFAFYAGTLPEKTDLVVKEIFAEAALLCETGLSSDELNRAKAKVLGQRKIGRQDLGSLAMAMALDELYGLGYKHHDEEDALYDAVTSEQVIAVAKKYLDPKKAVSSVLRPDTAETK
jgi:zinc protease